MLIDHVIEHFKKSDEPENNQSNIYKRFCTSARKNKKGNAISKKGKLLEINNTSHGKQKHKHFVSTEVKFAKKGV